MKKDVQFFSESSIIKGHLYIPDTYQEGQKLPALVLCHGFAGVKELLLPNFAEAFCNSGYIVLAFDYRGFGESEGENGRISPTNQILDIRNAITYMQGLNEVDEEKIGLWGTSYGGANAMMVASVDKRIKCLVVQLTFGNGERVITGELNDAEKTKLMGTISKLWTKKVTTNKDLLLPIIKVLTDEQSKEFYNSNIENFPQLKIKIPFLTMKETMEHKPENHLSSVTAPILIVGAANDGVNPVSESRSIYEKANDPKELFIVEDATHYEVYEGALLEQVSAKELDWFNNYLV